jgi:hypothetical protein
MPMPSASMWAAPSSSNPKYEGLNSVWVTRPSSITA